MDCSYYATKAGWQKPQGILLLYTALCPEASARSLHYLLLLQGFHFIYPAKAGFAGFVQVVAIETQHPCNIKKFFN